MERKFDAEVSEYADWDYNIKVAGVSFYQDELATLEPQPWEHLDITLEREPNNEYDANAIKVIVNKKQVGFIPATIAKVMAKQMDEGATFDAKVIFITKREGKKIHTLKLALNRR